MGKRTYSRALTRVFFLLKLRTGRDGCEACLWTAVNLGKRVAASDTTSPSLCIASRPHPTAGSSIPAYAVSTQDGR